MVPSRLAASTTMRSSQNAKASRQAPIFAASSLVIMIALSRGTPVSSRRKIARSGARLGGPARPRDKPAGAVTRHQIDEDHLAAIRFDDLVPDDFVAGVIAALDQHGWAHLPDQLQRRVLLEHHHEIDGLERGEHISTSGDVLERAAVAFEARTRSIAVETNPQPVAGRARRRHQPDVSAMQ